jgi:hypothetical protein
MVEGQLGSRKKIGPAIRGKGNMAGRQDGKEVVLPCADGPFRAVGAVILGGNILTLDGRLRGAEKIGEVGRGLIIQLDVSDGTGMRREEGTGRAKSMDIRGSGARLEGNEVNVIAMQQDKNIFETVVRWDGETTGEVGRRPFTAGNGAGASGVGRKGRNRGSKARASARRKSHSRHRTQTRFRDFAASRCDTLA